jgi:hypothetical protein
MQESINAPTCSRADDLMTWLYGESNEKDARNFEQHLLTCSQCSEDVAAFRGIRESLFAWRQEALGISAVPSAAPVYATIGARKQSAIAALREFFTLSPLWLKGAVAFASMLFCLLAVLAVARFRETPQAPVAGGNIYTDQELESLVAARARKMLEEKRTNEKNISQPNTGTANATLTPKKTLRGATGPSTQLASKGTKKHRLLTREEREQLAADLRLTADKDDADLDLFGDRLNRQEE